MLLFLRVWSGASRNRGRAPLRPINVVFWLEKHGLPASDEVVDRVLAAAKASESNLDARADPAARRRRAGGLKSNINPGNHLT